MTRHGTYLIEDGHITRPVRDVRFTDGRRFATGVVCPALRAGGFRVTGTTT